MLWIVVALVLASGLGGAAFLLRRRAPKQPPAALPRELSLATLGVGDIVTVLDRDFLVVEQADFEDGGNRWSQFLLSEGATQEVLHRVIGDEIECALLTASDTNTFVEPAPESVERRGRTYTLQSWGMASVRRRGEDGRLREQRCAYQWYTTLTGRLLLAQQCEGVCIELEGERRPSVTFELLPGELNRT